MNPLKKIIYQIRNFILDPLIYPKIPISNPPDAVSQLQLMLTYSTLAETGKKLPGIKNVGFKAYSQTDEDGILLYIFSIIGTKTKQCVEICSGDGIECNSANLIINHGWSGLLIDGNKTFINRGKEFYKKNRQTFVFPPTLLHSWVTRSNINQIIEQNGLKGQIDLLSLDMDGIDYWILEAINVIEPRVLVVEYQDIIGPERSLTVPYKDDFNSREFPMTSGIPNFSGASLPAFVKLAKKKGYRLVGCNKYGYNAFFIKNPLGEKEIPEIDIKECFTHPKVIWGMKERFQKVKDHPWVEI